MKKKSDASMPDMFDKISDESTFLGRLASKIPGFSGYIERSRRREADQLLREGISARLDAVRLELGNIQARLSRDIVLAIDFAEPLGQLDTKIMGLSGKVKDAPVGYAGFFDAVKVDEDDLANLYAFDESLLGYVDAMAAHTETLAAATRGGNFGAALDEFDEVASQAVHTFNARQGLLAGYNE